MSISRTDQFCLPIFAVSGSLTTTTVPRLLQQLDSGRLEGHQHLALDLSSIKYMEPEPAQVLRRTRAQMARQGCSLTLVGLSPAAIVALSQPR